MVGEGTQEVFVQHTSVVAVEHVLVDIGVDVVAPASRSDFAQGRAAVGAAHDAAHTRDAQNAVTALLHHQLALAADRTM